MSKYNCYTQKQFVVELIKNVQKIADGIAEDIPVYDWNLNFSGNIDSKKINPLRLMAIKNKHKKLTKRESDFLREFAEIFTPDVSFPSMVGAECGYPHDDWRIASKLEKKGFGLSLPDFERQKHSKFVIGELGVMWIMINAPDIFYIPQDVDSSENDSK